MHFYLCLSLTISFLTGNSASNIKRRHVLTTLRFHPLQASAYDGIYPVVAVPSRLYFHVSPEKPLNGKRITVKDNFHMDRMVTTLGNKAFAKYYGTQSMTSEYLKRVIDLGAIVVRKTKLSSFAGTEVPPRGPVDYLAPFNLRADGYQGPQGSSSGAGASAGGYDWIDASICTDSKFASINYHRTC